MNLNWNWSRAALVLATSLAWLAACGGGSSGHTISGTVTGVVTAGVTVTLSGASSATVTTPAGGAYAFPGLADGAYTVTPSKTGYVFGPASSNVTVSGGDVGGRSFVAALGTHTVTVQRVHNYWHEDGTGEDVPGLAGLVSVGAEGGPVVPAVEGPPGSFTATIQGGPYWVYVDFANGEKWRFRVPSGEDAMDMGVDMAGRVPPVPVLTAATGTGSLSGLQPWDAVNDTLELSSWNSGLSESAPTGIPGGSTSGSLTVSWNSSALQATDTLLAVQWRSSPATGGQTYMHAVAGASATGTVVPDTGTFTLQPLAFLASPTSALSANWSMAAFDAAVPPFVGGLTGCTFQDLWVSAMPRRLATSFLLTGGGTTLFWLSPTLGATISDTDFGPLAYANPLPARYEAYLGAMAGFDRPRTLPGASSPAHFQDRIERYDPITAVPNPIVPKISAVRNLKVNGSSALSPLTGVGTAPLLTWDPPSTGSATYYRVSIDEVYLPTYGAPARTRRVAVVTTDLTQAALGPNLLLAGKSYVVGVSAADVPGTASGQRPFRFALPMGWSDVWSEIISP